MNNNVSVSSNLIRTYLERQGWSCAKTNRNGIVVLVEPHTSSPLEVFIPDNEQVPGYLSLINDAIETIALYEDRSRQLVIASVRAIDFDLHNYRVKRTIESIPIIFLEELLVSAKCSLREAARVEQASFLDKLKPTSRNKYASAKEESEFFIKGCNFGHTWRGSFGLTLEAPLGIPSIGIDSQSIPESIGRKASRRIISSMRLVEEAMANGSPNFIVDNPAGKNVLILSSLPLLEEYLITSDLEYTLTLSPLIKVEDSCYSAKFNINAKMLRYIEKASDQLKVPENEFDTEIIGFPETISASREVLLQQVDGDRKVIVRGTCREQNTITLKLELSLEDYKKALKAQEEVCSVVVGCRIKKMVRGWEVLRLDYFDLIFLKDKP